MIRRFAGIALTLVMLTGSAMGEAAPSAKPGDRQAEGKAQPKELNEPRQAGLPNDYRLNLLIRTTLVALNQANVTGNYSVLRDLGAPGFQKMNSAAKLAEAFASLRNRDLDLSPILFFEPKLVRPPFIQPNGQLRLSGYFETAPDQVKFDLAFERGERGWLLFGIAVEVSPPTANASNSTAPTGDPSGNSASHSKAVTKEAETALKGKASPPAPESKNSKK